MEKGGNEGEGRGIGRGVTCSFLAHLENHVSNDIFLGTEGRTPYHGRKIEPGKVVCRKAGFDELRDGTGERGRRGCGGEEDDG